MTARTLRTSAVASREELADALQSVFLTDLLVPSKPLWLVTPWISDVMVLDNRANTFSGLLMDLPRRQMRLLEVLLLQLTKGGSVVIACRPDDHNRPFIDQILLGAQEAGSLPRLRCQYAQDLHEKGILSDQVLMSGSMNLTYNGLRKLEESVFLTDDPDAMARARHAYEDRWGLP